MKVRHFGNMVNKIALSRCNRYLRHARESNVPIQIDRIHVEREEGLFGIG